MNFSYMFLIVIGTIVFFRKYVLKKEDNVSIYGIENSGFTRVIATYCIMFGHTTAAVGGNFEKINLGWHYVAIFFLWSGYRVVYSFYKKENYLNGFLFHRLVKILVPFLGAHLVYLCIKSITGVRFNWLDLIQGIVGGLNIVEYSWYPIAALIMYLLFYFVWRTSYSEKRKIFMCFLALVGLTIIEWMMVGRSDWWYISNFSFIIGIIMYHKRWDNKLYLIFGGLCNCFIGRFLLSVCGHMFGTYPQPIYIISANIQTTSMAIASIAAFSVFPDTWKKSKVVCYLNKVSYEMYLYHGLVIYTLKMLTTNGYIIFLGVLLSTPLLAGVMYWIDALIMKKVYDYSEVRYSEHNWNRI